MSVATPHVPRLPMRGGAAIPQLGLGVFQVAPEDTAAVVGRALEAGYRHVDTAAAYGNEAGVGEALRGAELARDDVFVTTKLWNHEHGGQAARQACEASLRRLGLDSIDLYLIHWPVPAQDRYVEAWQALVELQSRGLVRAIGVSNFGPTQLERIVETTGVVPAVNQVELHPAFQQRALRGIHEEMGIVTEAWSPLAQGRALADPAVAELAQSHDRTPAQVVLRWHLQHGHVVIPKSVTPARIDENLDVFDFALTEAEMSRIDELDSGQRIGPDPETFGA